MSLKVWKLRIPNNCIWELSNRVCLVFRLSQCFCHKWISPLPVSNWLIIIVKRCSIIVNVLFLLIKEQIPIFLALFDLFIVKAEVVSKFISEGEKVDRICIQSKCIPSLIARKILKSKFRVTVDIGSLLIGERVFNEQGHIQGTLVWKVVLLHLDHCLSPY